jgi:hypothetical protein
MQFLKEPKSLNAIPVGAALGLAIFTKGTAYIYAFPFVIWYLVTIAIHETRQLLKVTFIVFTLFLAINGSHFLRNYALWRNPLAGDVDKVQTTRRDPQTLMSNLSRNIASNTWTPSSEINFLQYRAVEHFHGFLNIDINDPETTLDATEFVQASLSLHEDVAGNGLHTLLILFLAPAALFFARDKALFPVRCYFFALISSILLFCLMLKWQTWVTRLQLPGFVLAAPLLAVAIPGTHKIWLTRIMMGLLLIAATPWLFYNESRPLLGEWSIIGAERDTLYFANNQGLFPHFDQVTAMIAATPLCSQIAIYGNESAYDFEYPFWVLIRHRAANMPRIEFININNISNKIPLKDFNPCLKVEMN